VSVSLELKTARLDVQRIAHEYGEPVKVRFRGEDQVVRDALGSVKSRKPGVPEFTVYAYPRISNPDDRQLSKAGIREQAEELIWTPAKDWDDQSIAFGQIDTERTTFIIDGEEWRISGSPSRNLAGLFGSGYLYYTFGIKRV
jgi:hypothetical protein